MEQDSLHCLRETSAIENVWVTQIKAIMYNNGVNLLKGVRKDIYGEAK